MKVLALLYAAYLLGFGSCEDDKVIEIQPLTYTTILSRQILDIARINTSTFTVYQCNDNGNEIVFVVPNNGVIVTTIINNDVGIWSPQQSEKFDYLKIYLKHGQPHLLYIMKTSLNFSNCRWYVRNKDKWECCSKTYNEHIDKLKIPLERTYAFTLDIENGTDTTECQIFDIKLAGAPMRLFFSKSGYYSDEVVDGQKLIWRAERNEKCISSDVYLENFRPVLIIIFIINEKGEDEYKHLKKTYGEWYYLSREDFETERDGLRNYHPTRMEMIEKLIVDEGIVSWNNIFDKLVAGLRTAYQYSYLMLSRFYNLRNLRCSNNTTELNATVCQELESVVVYTHNVGNS
ncbi:signal peptide containing protein [Theileria equi strain WA]|uniref:Signal peptide containing protein n=1 Tax=Theileria equi strain WA TaxID=1537102 RepID=L1LFQ5_THEEQ|nr:signal peptide containing protein [Theileria equi strain WA]EKX73993.1 signal peptide containing protein [Theileria equi strain WA]|eukprot:XP_004833445.1 signal peptide containing protein [Theileria equi strain WA]